MKLLDYIRGHHKGKEAHRLEKESMKDSFLADAMDGYQQIKGNHESKIEELRQQVSARSSKKRNTYAVIWSIAASLIIGLGVSTYFLFLKKDVIEDTFVAQETVIEKDMSSPLTILHPGDEGIETKSDTSVRVAVTSVPPPPMIKEQVSEMANDIVSAKQSGERVLLSKTSERNNVLYGKVTDENGEPLPGATVFFKGTNIGTLTNANGEFALDKIKESNELTANYIGYEPINISLDSCQNVLIAMNQDKQALDEIVVVGYGTQKKSSITGSAVSISQPSNRDKLHAPQPIVGRRKYRKYLEDHLIRPTDATCKDVKGKVTLSFFVDKKGNPQRIVVIKSLCKSADKEAIRLVKEGPKWTHSILPVEIKVKF